MVKIGFIGIGAMAHNHLQRLKKISHASVIAGADPLPEKRQRAESEYGLRTYPDYRRMLDEEALDAVYVCLPPFAHEGQEIEVVSRDLAIFVEKPIDLDLANANKTAQAIKASGVINSVGYMCRYLDVVERAKEMLADRPIAAMRGFYFAPLPGTPWWRQAKLSGGQIIEQATHVVDLMRYFAGEADRVQGDRYLGLMTSIENYDVDDAANVNFHFQNGALANLMTTCILENQYCPGFEIIAKGMRLWLDLPPRPAILRQMDGVDQEWHSEHDRFMGENEAFIQAVEAKDQNLILSSYADAIKTLALTLAAQQAVESDQSVFLD
jgi:predicted dehydrogenase